MTDEVVDELPAAVAAALAAARAAGRDLRAPRPGAIEDVMRAVRARAVPAPAPGASSRARLGLAFGRGGRTWRHALIAASLAGVAVGVTRAWPRRFALGPADGPAHTTRAGDPARAAGESATAVSGTAVSGPAAHTAHFVLLAPGARHIAVVGDFNGWDAVATPMRRDVDTGAWTATLELPAGRYVYAYLVDGARWMPDPNAPLAPADGFGRQSSVLVFSTQYAVR